MVPFVGTEAVAVFDNVKLVPAVTVVLTLPQLVVAHPEPGVAGLAPPDGSTDAKLVIVPADPGAVAVSVNTAVPFAAPAASPALSVTVHVNNADAVFKFVQLTVVTPAPAVAAVACTPVGNWSATVTEVPETAPPLLPR